MTRPPIPRRARDEDLPAAFALRVAVFCGEQGVPEELERDDLDDVALHLVLDDVGTVVGTCRILRDGPRARIGRMAVAPGRRGEGLGAALLEHAHAVAREEGAREAELHAQVAVLGFYERAGYAVDGGVFEEAGIAHVLMRRPLA